MSEQTAKLEYLYRYRSWDSSVWYGTRDKDSIDVDAAWGEWEFCDEKKYNEICELIKPPHPNHYEAEKLLVSVVGSERFDPRPWLTAKGDEMEARRYSPNAHTSAQPVMASEGIFDVIESGFRAVGNAIVDTAGGIVDGIGDMCD